MTPAGCRSRPVFDRTARRRRQLYQAL